MKVIIVTFLDAVATVNVLTTSNNDVKLVETGAVDLASLLNRCYILKE